MTEYEQLKAQKDELLQREREMFERPLLAEIDRMKLDFNDACMIIRRSLKYLPDDLKAKSVDWLERRGPKGSVLREEV